MNLQIIESGNPMLTPESILMFKPDAQDVRLDLEQPLELHKLGAALLVSAGLEVIDYSRSLLTGDAVRELYEKALAPNPEDDAIWGTAWKEDVVAHIASAPVDSYLFGDSTGEAIPKTKALKDFLRRHYARTDNVVQNIAHVPDADEMEVAKRILFNQATIL